MHRLAALPCLLVVALAAPAAENKSDADAHARAVAPFLDERTVVVAHVDLTRLDVDALAAKFVEVVKVEPADLSPFRQQARKLLAGLTKSGATDVYLVLSLADLSEAPFVVVPLRQGVDAQAVITALGRVPFLADSTRARLDDAVVAGREAYLERLRQLKPIARPEVAPAFAATGDTPAQVLFLPTADSRRIFEEMMPTLPKEVGGGPIKPLTRGLQWLAVGLDFTPRLSMQVVVQFPDAPAARALNETLAGIIKTAGKQTAVRAFLPDYDKLAAALEFKVTGDRLTLAVDEKTLLSTLQPPLLLVKGEVGPRLQRTLAQQSRSAANLHDIGAALHKYHDKNMHFPPAALRDKQGKPLLSWRVLLLPFLGEEKLYKEFHLDEPWDSAHNKPLVARMPAVFGGTDEKLVAAGETTFLAPIGSETMFPPGSEGVSIAEVTDGTSNTIFLVDADDAHALPWTRPVDWKYDPNKPAAGLGGHHHGGFLTLFVDGSVHFVRSTIDKAVLQAVFTRAGGEVVPETDLFD